MQRAGSLFGEFLQFLERRKPLFVEFHRPCIDHVVQDLARNGVPADSLRQCLRHGMLARSVFEDTLDRLMPPSQPNLTQRRLPHSIPDPGQFQIQGEKREKIRSPFIRREQG